MLNVNIPYVAAKKANGQNIPLLEHYINFHPNRKQRRIKVNKDRFCGNNKGVSISVIGKTSYFRVAQLVPYKDVRKGKEITVYPAKLIYHYILKS